MSRPLRNLWQIRQHRRHHCDTSIDEKSGYLSSESSLEDNVVSYSDAHWMADVNDNTLLSSLTIPGTHDSAAYTSSLPFVSTQKLNIIQQLEAGIRYMDLRCGVRDDVVEMVHGSTYLGHTLAQVLDTFYEWLDSHPMEALIVQIKEDRQSVRSTVPFDTAVLEHIAARTKLWRIADTTPTIGELRGKIQLFRRFTVPNTMTCGINVTEWMNNPSTPFTIRPSRDVQLTIQDHYDFPDPVPLSNLVTTKDGDVSGLLDCASRDLEAGHWYLNFTSASELNIRYQISPRNVAVGGYSLFRWVDGLNPRLAKFMKAHIEKGRFGIVVMDFPEQGASDLVHMLIMSNFQPKTPTKAQTWILFSLMILLAVLFSLAVGFGLVFVERVASMIELTGEAGKRDLILAAGLNA